MIEKSPKRLQLGQVKDINLEICWWLLVGKWAGKDNLEERWRQSDNIQITKAATARSNKNIST